MSDSKGAKAGITMKAKDYFKEGQAFTAKDIFAITENEWFGADLQSEFERLVNAFDQGTDAMKSLVLAQAAMMGAYSVGVAKELDDYYKLVASKTGLKFELNNASSIKGAHSTNTNRRVVRAIGAACYQLALVKTNKGSIFRLTRGDSEFEQICKEFADKSQSFIEYINKIPQDTAFVKALRKEAKAAKIRQYDTMSNSF